MFRLDIQFFGGRGSSSVTRAKGGGLNPGDIVSTTSLVSARETDRQMVDDVLSVFKDVSSEYGYQIGDIELATLKGKSASGVLGYYDGENIAINQSYFNARMESAYKDSVASGWHPSNGNKTGLQAVAAHELGHALTDKVGAKMGISGIDNIATKVINEARKSTKHRGVVQMSKKISGYATSSNAEALAEAFADVFCNGKKAASESRAIVDVMNKYLK